MWPRGRGLGEGRGLTWPLPPAVAPFSGATTGTGGRIRDVQCTGRGAHVIAGTAGYSFGNLLLPGETPNPPGTPRNYAPGPPVPPGIPQILPWDPQIPTPGLPESPLGPQHPTLGPQILPWDPQIPNGTPKSHRRTPKSDAGTPESPLGSPKSLLGPQNPTPGPPNLPQDPQILLAGITPRPQDTPDPSIPPQTTPALGGRDPQITPGPPNPPQTPQNPS